ncbi:hypothetical protein [Arthrobacter celericrescens]|uniref:hypothetical protein n=1 Tax=Arthrobacter celericrescens TaxID=2320851 RepID=UPI0013C4B2D9|nr:hypothetical protein [Arthrobacter celericrescens]
MIDITGAKAHTEQRALAALVDFAALSADDSVVIIAGFNQNFPPINNVNETATSDDETIRISEDTLLVDEKFAERIMNEVQHRLDQGGEVILYSFLSRVGDAFRSKFAGIPAASYESIGRIMAGTAADSAVTVNWDSRFMDEDEAVSHLVSAVASRPEGVYQTALHDLLVQRDKRFEKRDGSFTSSKGFMKLLVKLGIERGLIGVLKDGQNPTNPMLTVSSTPARGAGNHTAVHGTTSPTPEARREKPSPGSGSGSRELAQYYWDLMREHRVGPYQQVREHIYNALERSVQESTDHGPTSTAEEIIERAIAVVRKAWVIPNGRKNLPWDDVQEFLRKLLREEPVLRSGEQLIGPWYGIGEPKVTDILPKFRERLDGQCLRFLLNLSEVSVSEKAALASVLFNSPTEDNQRRVQDIIEGMLHSSELLIDKATGALSLLPRNPPTRGNSVDASIEKLTDTSETTAHDE